MDLAMGHVYTTLVSVCVYRCAGAGVFNESGVSPGCKLGVYETHSVVLSECHLPLPRFLTRRSAVGQLLFNVRNDAVLVFSYKTLPRHERLSVPAEHNSYRRSLLCSYEAVTLSCLLTLQSKRASHWHPDKHEATNVYCKCQHMKRMPARAGSRTVPLRPGPRTVEFI